MDNSLTNGVCVEVPNGNCVVQESCESTSSNTNSAIDRQLPADSDLSAQEALLQKRYQIDVIRSFDYPTFPPPKAYPAAQKEIGAKFHDLCNESHFLTLRLKHLQQQQAEALRCLEKKWISSVDFSAEKESLDDEVSKELKFWSLQMKAYEENFAHALKSDGDFRNTQIFQGQLCFDSSWKQEAFQETLEFTTENHDCRLKVLIRYDGDEFSVDCSMHLVGLRQVVEKCFAEKCSIDELIMQIWGLFDTNLGSNS